MEKNNQEMIKDKAIKREKLYILTAKYYHYLGKIYRKENIDKSVKGKMSTWKKEIDSLQTEYNFR